MIRQEAADDAGAIAAVWAAAHPHLVVTEVGTRARLLRRDPGVTMHQWVGTAADGRVVAESRLRLESADHTRAMLALVVHPDERRHGIGGALLAEALPVARAHGVDVLHALADDQDGVTVAEQWGARRVRPHTVNACDPADAPAPESPPAGLRLVGCDALPDRAEVLAVLNDTAADDPSGLSHTMTPDAFASFWQEPDHHPELGAAVLDGARVLAFTSTRADLGRGRAFTSITASRREARGRGLATLVKSAALRAMTVAGIRSAATVNDDENGPMLAVNRRVGYVPAAQIWSVELPLR